MCLAAAGLALVDLSAGRVVLGIFDLFISLPALWRVVLGDVALDLQALQQLQGEVVDVAPAAVGASEIRALHGSQF